MNQLSRFIANDSSCYLVGLTFTHTMQFRIMNAFFNLFMVALVASLVAFASTANVILVLFRLKYAFLFDVNPHFHHHHQKHSFIQKGNFEKFVKTHVHKMSNLLQSFTKHILRILSEDA